MLLSLSLVIAIGLIFLKGGDLLLRAHHRKAIQAFLEDTTLRVELLDLSHVAKGLVRPEVQFCFMLLGYFELFAIILLNILLQPFLWRILGGLPDGLGTPWLFAGTAIVATATCAVCWKWPTPQLVRLMVGSGRNRFVVMVRMMAILYCVMGVVVLLNAVVQQHLVGYGVGTLTTTMVGLFIVGPPMVAVGIASQAVGAMVQPRSRFVRGAFYLIRGVLWRIVEYERGAVAAILLVVAIGLGTVAELLK